MQKVVKWTYWSLLFSVAIGVSAGLGGLAVVGYQVQFGDTEALEKTTILAKLQEETRIYYADGKTQMGSLFENKHRRYISIDEIPPHVQNAIVAAEDKNFYEHFGFDVFATGKAFIDGVTKGGRFRGASTITQQTVKNLLNDWEMSFTRKIREAIRAIQLEKIYDKKQILEFYLNQFHVAGNGNGIGIAARYYFDKEVRDISLVEAAFIAGSVKGPSKYNPFIKYTKKSKERARFFANQRKNYVLSRMYEHKWISEDEYLEAKQAPVPFKKGEFRTTEVTLVDLVRTQLKKKEVLDALNLESADQLNIAGYKVITTIDHELQESAQLVMRRNLSRLETILKGYKSESKKNYKTLPSLQTNEFYYGKVSKLKGTSIKDFEIQLSFGLPEGTISHDSLVRYAKLLDLPVGHAKGYKHHLKELRKKIKVGDILFVEAKNYDKSSHHADLELHKRPDISGGMIALDKGRVKAVISGFDTQGFNRAMYARRQPGSVFKSLVYFAALQLGWSVLDTIDNDRQVFAYQGNFYYPRPDHASPYDETSMLWSGIMSENLASVSLAANLLDKLSFTQFKKLLDFMGLLPESGERARDYHYRVARKIGVELSNEGIKAMQLKNSIEDLAPDLVFSGENKTLQTLRKMWWGNGYENELQALYQADKEKYTSKEMRTRRDLALNNFKRMSLLAERIQSDWTLIENAVAEKGPQAVLQDDILKEVLGRFSVLSEAGSQPGLAYDIYDLEEEQPKQNEEPSYSIHLRGKHGRPLNAMDIQAIWKNSEESWFQENANSISITDVKLSGYLPLNLYIKLQKDIDDRFNEIVAEDADYKLRSYFQHYDFRVGLGLNYLVELCRSMGVFSHLEPVLSFPLGTNDITANEVAKMYQTFIDGKTYRFFDKGPENQLTFISKIEDRFGNLLYEPKAIIHDLATPSQASQMREVLHKVVTHGTARSRARGELYVELEEGTEGKKKNKVRIPAFGKTGTTNDFTTSYFAGFMPYPVDFGQPLNPSNSYVISTYVGYDQPKEMRRGRQRIYGGTGALPAWTDFAKEIIKIKNYRDYIDPFDLQVISKKEWPLAIEGGTQQKMVDLPRGLILRTGSISDLETWETTDIANTGEDFFNPFALGNSVQSLVSMHSQHDSRSFKAFSRYEQEEMEAEPVLLKKSDTMKMKTQKTMQEVNQISLKPGTSNQQQQSSPKTKEEEPERAQELW